MNRAFWGRSAIAAACASFAWSCSSAEFSSGPRDRGDAGEAGADFASGGERSQAGEGGAGSQAGEGGEGNIPDRGGGPTIATASAAYAVAYCERYERCFPAYFSDSWSSRAVCVNALRVLQEASFGLPGTGKTPASLATCAAEYALKDCRSLVPAECIVAGKLADGVACSADEQCAATSCSARNGECGVCGRRSEDGDTCSAQNCAAGLSCVYNGTKNYCAVETPEGADCYPGHACPGGCLAGKCQPGGSGVGGPCPCRYGDGLLCEDSRCVVIAFGDSGAACDESKQRRCLGASKCLASGVCSPVAKLGESCDASNPCETPYVCNAMTGKCEAPPAPDCF